MKETDQNLLNKAREFASVDSKEGVILLKVTEENLRGDQVEIIEQLRPKGWIIQYALF